MTALSPTQRASAVGVKNKKAAKIVGASLRPEVMIIMAQGNTGTALGALDVPFEVFSNQSYAATYGYASPINLSIEAAFKVNQGITLYALPVGEPAGGAAAVGAIATAAGTASKTFTVIVQTRGLVLSQSIAKDLDQDAIALLIQSRLVQELRIPFSTDIDTGTTDNIVDLEALFQGIDGNDITLNVTDSEGNAITAAVYGVDITFTPFNAGAGVTTTTTAIENIPETLKVTRFVTQIKDTATLDLIKQLGDDRNAPLLGEIVRGYYPRQVDTTSKTTINSEYTTILGEADARILDDVTSLSPMGGKGFPIEQLSEIITRVMVRYIFNAGHPPRGLKMQFAASAPLTDNWFSATQRDLMYKSGITNYENHKTFMKLFDLCVTYHPANDNILSENPPVTFNDEDATAIGNMQYSVIVTFSSGIWEAVKFIEEEDVTTNPQARKLSDVAAQCDKLITSWLNPNLFIKKIALTKEDKIIVFDGLNSERVNMTLPVTLASTGRIYDMVLSSTKSNS